MELFRTNDFYIFVNGEYSLWWDRQTAAFIPKTGKLALIHCFINNLNCHMRVIEFIDAPLLSLTYLITLFTTRFN